MSRSIVGDEDQVAMGMMMRRQKECEGWSWTLYMSMLRLSRVVSGISQPTRPL